MESLRNKIVTRNTAIQLFNKLNKDGRYTVTSWGYNQEFQIPEVMLNFCEKPVFDEPLLIEREEDGVELFLIAFLESFKRFSDKWKNETPIIELRINRLKSKSVGFICIDYKASKKPKWVRISYSFAQQIINHKALQVIYSNREGYISDFQYLDYFKLKINPQWFFEENDDALKCYAEVD